MGTAWQIGFGNSASPTSITTRRTLLILPPLALVGGIIATFSFLSKDAPKYIPGYSICIAFTILSILACFLYGFACWSANKHRQKTPVDVGLTEYEKTELGDLNPEYRYLL